MSELEKLVAAEVTKQLAARNSLPNVKRASVTAAQWRALVLVEAWGLMVDASTLRTDKAGVEWFMPLPEHLQCTQEDYGIIPKSIIVDAVHNVGAPAKFGTGVIRLVAGDALDRKLNYFRVK